MRTRLDRRCGKAGASVSDAVSACSSTSSSSNDVVSTGWVSAVTEAISSGADSTSDSVTSSTNSCSSTTFEEVSSAPCASEKTPCGSASTSTTGSSWRLRCLEIDSPGSMPLPSHSMGDSTSVEGLKVLAGRTGVTGAATVRVVSSAGAPPYFESDSPGRTNGGAVGTGAASKRGSGTATLASGDEDLSLCTAAEA